MLMAAQEPSDAAPRRRTQFADLVKTRREELGLSLAALSDAAIDPETNTRVTSAWIHRLETGKPVVPPDYHQLRAFAAGLRLPLAALQAAAGAQFFGLDTLYSANGYARALVERLDEMNEDQQRRLLALIDSFMDTPE